MECAALYMNTACAGKRHFVYDHFGLPIDRRITAAEKQQTSFREMMEVRWRLQNKYGSNVHRFFMIEWTDHKSEEVWEEYLMKKLLAFCWPV